MPTYLVHCAKCGAEFAPDHRAIVTATWRLCPDCQPQPHEQTRCERCGRVLRAGKRTLCLGCAMGMSAP
jgi:hypothetical protein